MHALDRPNQGGVKTRTIATCSIILSAALSLWWQNASAAVTQATLTPAVKVYSGDCPAKIVFNGSITVNAPGIVNYIFTRSDGATDTQIKTLKFLAAGSKPVSTSWTLGGSSLPSYKGWQAVKIVGTAIESAHADFELSCDPPANSAKAAHGNTDWHIDTANEFLFGKDMANNNTAANFAPAGWTKTHIHVGQSNAAHFYNDKARVATGDDTDATNGIDKPMLFFYAGHGNPTTWNALGTNGHQTDTLIGNIAGGGQLRYYWQCSCEVFAHGPQVCSGGDCDYSQPENFDGSADSAAMRNVFERWGPALGNDLRMACGVSTLAYCHEGNVNAIWNQFNNHGASVADAFINGLGSASVKPLCITRGGSNIVSTPLYDETFTNRRNTSGTSHLHILYAGGTQTQHPLLDWKPEMIPLKLLRVRLVPPGDPVEFNKRLTIVRKVEQLRDVQLAGGRAVVRRNAESGALHLRAVGKAQAVVARDLKTEPAQQQIALNFVRKLGWTGEDVGVIRSNKLLTASMPVGGKAADITRGEKGVVVTIGRRIKNGNQTLDVLGQGGRIDVTLGGDGKVQAASRVWRQAQIGRDEIAIKPYAQALKEAQRQLQKVDAYKLADWRFGYKEESANVDQRELPVIFEFDFVPKNREELIDFPPQQIEISAETK
jgi:hypothetical protein